jgi:hypothetical protein
MPAIRVDERIIDSNDYTDIVIAAYHEALKKSGFDLTAEATSLEIKSKLTIAEKVLIPGLKSKLLRFANYHEATFTLTGMELNLLEWPCELYASLKNKLIEELSSATLMQSHPNGLSDLTLRHQYITDTSKYFVNKKIDNHYILICEILCRIAIVALSSNFMEQKVLEEVHEDKYVVLLKNFIDQLFLNITDSAKLFTSQNMFASFLSHSGVSTFATFLKTVMAEQWAQAINSMIYSQITNEQPKLMFDAASGCVKAIRTTLRGYMLVLLHEFSLKILKDVKPLITDPMNIDPAVIDVNLESAMKVLVSKLDPDVSTAMMVNKEENKITWLEQSYNAIVNVFKSAISKKSTKEQAGLLEILEQVKAHFDTDIQLMLINDAVGQFTYMCSLGGWIPILLGVIRPEELAKAIIVFIGKYKQLPKIGKVSNQDIQLALLRLPNTEFIKLELAANKIGHLSDRHIMVTIRNRFSGHLGMLKEVQTKMVDYRLLSNDQPLISNTAAPLLTDEFLIEGPPGSSLILTPTPPLRRLGSREREVEDDKHSDELVQYDPAFGSHYQASPAAMKRAGSDSSVHSSQARFFNHPVSPVTPSQLRTVSPNYTEPSKGCFSCVIL